MRANGRQHGVNQIVRPLDGRRSGHVARNPDREEQRVEAALAHPRDVDVPVRVALADVEGLVEDEPLDSHTNLLLNSMISIHVIYANRT